MKRSLALSGAIHALVFLALLIGGLPRVEVSAPRVIQVLLLQERREGRGEPAGARPATASEDPAAARKEKHAAARKTRTAPARPRVERARGVERAARREAVGPIASNPAPAGGSTAATGSGASPAAVRGSVGAGGGAPSGEERDHRIAIIRKRIQEALIYPREARRRGIQGTSHVRFDLTDAGRLRTIAVARTSGKSLLDDASLRTVERAQPFPFVDGTLIVPVVFRLSGAR